MKPSVKQRASSYQQIISGEWVSLKGGFHVACCDCGLIHDLDVKVINGTPHIRFTVMPKATATYRRHHKDLVYVKAKTQSRRRS